MSASIALSPETQTDGGPVDVRHCRVLLCKLKSICVFILYWTIDVLLWHFGCEDETRKLFSGRYVITGMSCSRMHGTGPMQTAACTSSTFYSSVFNDDDDDDDDGDYDDGGAGGGGGGGGGGGAAAGGGGGGGGD